MSQIRYCLCLLLLVAPGATAQDDIQQFRAIIDQQQRIIERLESVQRQQQKEIEELKELVGSREEPAEPAPAGEPRSVSFEWNQQQLDEWTVEALGGRAEAAAQPAPRSEATSSPEGFRVSVGGHINRAMNVGNDGADTKVYFVDSGNVPTSMYVKASKPVTNDLTIGGQIAFSLQHNSALAVSQDNEVAGLAVGGRFFEVTADSKRYGKLSFGQGFASSFYLAEIDKSGTWGYNLLSPGNTFGGLRFVRERDNSLSDIPVSLAFVDLETFSLLSRVRYDSPVWKGFRISGDAGERQFADATLRWNGAMGDFDVMFASSFQNNPRGGRVDWRVDGGVGLLHKPSGWNLTAGGARQNFNRQFAGSDPASDGFVVRTGLRRKWFSIGETRTAADFSRGRGVTIPRDTADSVGIFLGQEIKAWNMEPYIGYRWYRLDDTGIALRDIHGLTLGVRMSFDLTVGQPDESVK